VNPQIALQGDAESRVKTLADENPGSWEDACACQTTKKHFTIDFDNTKNIIQLQTTDILALVSMKTEANFDI
jgi:hypothetical protein